MRALRSAGLVLAAGLATGNAFAHRGHDTLSVVEIDGGSGQVSVTHHLAAHDIEPGVLREIAPQAQPSLDDAQALAALTGYVGRHFALADDSGEVALQLDDVQLSGDDIQLRYRGRLRDAHAPLQAHALLFAEVYPEISNQVNVRRDGVTRTLVFGEGPEWQPVSFEE